MEPLAIAGIVVLAIAVIGLGIWWDRKRRKAIEAWGAEHGLRFDPGKADYEGRFPVFKSLRQGSNRYARNRLEGEWQGRGFWGFDYHYETYSTDSKGHRHTQHHRWSGVILDAALALDPLSLRPRRLLDTVADWFGVQDINFEHAQFSRAFRVQSPNRRWAFDVLHQRAIDHLLATPRWNLELGGRWVLVWQDNLRPPADWGEGADLASGLLDALPSYVRTDRSLP